MEKLSRTAWQLVAGLVVVISLTVTPAGAATGWYVGTGGGTTSLDGLDALSAGDLEAALGGDGFTVTLDNLAIDNSDTGLKIFGGFQFNEYSALEAFYADLGSHDASFQGTVDDGGGSPFGFAATTSAESHGFGMFAVLIYPLGSNLSLMGKAGGIHWDTDIEARVSVDGTPFAAGEGDDGTDFAWGGGLRYRIGDHLGLDVQYEEFTTLDDIELISGNVTWWF